MLNPYIAYGFTFYENSEGLIYISNIQDMIELHGQEMVEDCINACEFYNKSVIKSKTP